MDVVGEYGNISEATNLTFYGNNSTIETEYDGYRYSYYDYILDGLAYSYLDKILITYITSFTFIIGIIGNVLTLIVIARRKDMYTSVNMYLANIAICDLLISMLAPILPWVSYVRSPKVHNFHDISLRWEVMWICNGIGFTSFLFPAIVYWTILFLSAERYIAICHPIKFRSIKLGSLSVTIKICVFIWVVLIAWTVRGVRWMTEVQFHFEFPDGYKGVSNVGYACYYCDPVKHDCDIAHKMYTVDILLEILVMLIVTVFYIAMIITLKRSKFNKSSSTGTKTRSKSEKKIFITVVVTVTVYMALRSPFLTLNIANLYFVDNDYDVRLFGLGNASRIMGYINSIVNPLIYVLLNDKFRVAFKETISCGRFKDTGSKNKQIKPVI